eukprot:2451690-Rhodomonas_salina.2
MHPASLVRASTSAMATRDPPAAAPTWVPVSTRPPCSSTRRSSALPRATSSRTLSAPSATSAGTSPTPCRA